MPTKRLVMLNQRKEGRICEVSTKLSGSSDRGAGDELLLVEFFKAHY